MSGLTLENSGFGNDFGGDFQLGISDSPINVDGVVEDDFWGGVGDGISDFFSDFGSSLAKKKGLDGDASLGEIAGAYGSDLFNLFSGSKSKNGPAGSAVASPGRPTQAQAPAGRAVEAPKTPTNSDVTVIPVGQSPGLGSSLNTKTLVTFSVIAALIMIVRSK